MLVKIITKGTKQGIELEDGRFLSFQGENQGRCYVNIGGHTISLNPSIKSHEDNTTINLDDYKSTRATKSTTEHASKPRKAKNAYNFFDYLSEEEKQQAKQAQQEIDNLQQEIDNQKATLAKLYAIASDNRKQEAAKLEAQRIAQKQAKEKAQKAKKLEQLKKLAQELGVKIA